MGEVCADEGDGSGCGCRAGNRDTEVYGLSLGGAVDAGPEEAGGIEELILAVALGGS